MGFADNTAKQSTIVVPHDDNEQKFAAIYVGGAGVVVIENLEGELIPHTMQAGGTVQAHCVKVKSTNTTASLMVGYND